jgi:hypothetical protein
MPTMAAMKDNVLLCKKANTDVSPEAWLRIGGFRRIALMRMSDRSALEAGAAIEQPGYQPTHKGLVETDADYTVGRVLVRKGDDQNYYILRVVEIGRRHGGTPARCQELILSEMPTKVTLT